MDLKDLLEKKEIVLYGLGTETQRLLSQWEGSYRVLGLLDSFQKEGEQFGYPIIDIDSLAGRNDVLILVVARPGSCKAIARKIGSFCRENDILLWDVRGNNLLDIKKVAYDFKAISGYSKCDLLEKIHSHDVISFDLFDTLIVRNTFNSGDVIEIVNQRLKEQGIEIVDFVDLRIGAEKELSKNRAPRLEEIYDRVLREASISQILPAKIALLEFETELSLLRRRDEVVSLISIAKGNGKSVFVTSDSYYSVSQIEEILSKLGITGIDGLFVSCEYNTGKTGNLFEELIKENPGKTILHIGDDLVADIESACSHEIDSFRIYSSADLLECLGGMSLNDELDNLSNRIRVGMFIAELFNSPFQFDGDKSISVKTAIQLGYLFCAPIFCDFTRWFGEMVHELEIANIWFCARDGYLMKKLYAMLYPLDKSEYFLTSRTAAIRAGVQDETDIQYVDSMKFSGSVEECLAKRFGIDVSDINKAEINSSEEGLRKYKSIIISSAARKKNNYLKYISSLDSAEGSTAFFDFVAKGTSQLYMQKIVENPIVGLYFLQLEPEYMKDKNIPIYPFYEESERDGSAIFENYYILETILTAPYPSVDEFDENGNPVFAKETRDDSDIKCFMSIQEGIIEYFKKYLEICPRNCMQASKHLDELFLDMIKKVKIEDEAFLNLTVEDPFFNRMTDIKDVL